jgi:predicted enzyme involved in methoxymalonyl-ACP biosynthesis
MLGNSATQLLVKALKGYGYEVDYNFDIFEGDYDQIEMQTYDPESELYKYKADYVIIYHSSEKLLNKLYELNNTDKVSFAERHIE